MNLNIYEVNELVHVKIHLLIQGHKYEHENKHHQELEHEDKQFWRAQL
jgi:hypothetical protein